MRPVVLLLCLLLGTALRAAEAPAIRAESLPSPAGPGSFHPASNVSEDGTAWMIWLERRGDQADLRFATLDSRTLRWSPAGTVARGVGTDVDLSAAPALTVGRSGHATALWREANDRGVNASDVTLRRVVALFSQTEDGGRTWSPPRAVTTESTALAHVTVTTLADGRTLAAWLDGRALSSGIGNTQLRAKILGTAGPDTSVDARVCESGPVALTALPDGSALIAYRGRTPDEVRDIRSARFRPTAWEPPQTVFEDRWKTGALSGSGPQLASDGGRIAVAWYTGADDNPRIMASLSPDAGARFLLPLPMTEAKVGPHVATALLHDGAILVTWVDVSGALWLRRITPDFTLAEPDALLPAGSHPAPGSLRLALLQDYPGGKTPARLLLSYVSGPESIVQTMLITVPEGELLEAEKNCDCSGNSEDVRGFSLRGRILAAPTAEHAMRVAHHDVPGIFEKGERTFPLAAEVTLPASVAGREFLGRFERRDGRWVLFSVRLIGSAP